MSGFIIVAPLPITDAILTQTDVPEADYAVWNGATAYVIGDRVIRTAPIHKVFQRAVAGTTATVPENDLVNWSAVGATNAWKLFDGSNSSQTAKSTSMFYRITPGTSINALYAGNITGATSIRVRVIDAVYGTAYDVTTDLTGSPRLPDWWQWFFGSWTANTSQVVLTDLPSLPNAEIRVDLVGDSTLAIGVLLLGQPTEFGTGIQYGARVGINDFSLKTVNAYGDTVITQRAYSKRGHFDVVVSNVEVDGLQEFLAGVRATACLYIGYGPLGATVIFGFYKTFEIVIAYPTQSTCAIDVEGLT